MSTLFLPIRPVRASALALSVALALGACASRPAAHPNLDQARAAYDSTAADPAVARSAPAELQRAQAALREAEAAQRDGDTARTDHYAYLAKQRVAIAAQAAQFAAAQKTIADSSAERDKILLEARTREAEAQRAQAEEARRQAQEQQQSAQAARQQASVLQQQLAAMNARQTQRGLVLTLGDVLFDTGKATLNPGAGRTVDQLAAFLRDNPDRSVQIEGYTDSTGSNPLNQSLSEQRAESVKGALLQRGIAAERVTARGFGDGNPVATNNTPAGRQLNRRIEVVISNTAS